MSTVHTALWRFGAIAVALICVQLDYFALALALPIMAVDLQTTPENLRWAVRASPFLGHVTPIADGDEPHLRAQGPDPSAVGPRGREPATSWRTLQHLHR